MGQYDVQIRKTQAALIDALNELEETKKVAATSAPSVAEFMMNGAVGRVNEMQAALQTFLDAND